MFLLGLLTRAHAQNLQFALDLQYSELVAVPSTNSPRKRWQSNWCASCAPDHYQYSDKTALSPAPTALVLTSIEHIDSGMFSGRFELSTTCWNWNKVKMSFSFSLSISFLIKIAENICQWSFYRSLNKSNFQFINFSAPRLGSKRKHEKIYWLLRFDYLQSLSINFLLVCDSMKFMRRKLIWVLLREWTFFWLTFWKKGCKILLFLKTFLPLDLF